MSYTTWTPHAVLSESIDWQGSAWRMVESQHIASTMKMVDNLDEQQILENLLEDSKPADCLMNHKPLHYLLATPFRYQPLRSGSRFRSLHDPGVFYGAESIPIACAELGYWRWRFLQDAVALEKIDPVIHSAFCVDICTQLVDLRQSPFDIDQKAWENPNEYSQTQAFAHVARAANLGAIQYQSVRFPEPGWCMALLNPNTFSSPKPHATMPTWWLSVYQDKVIWRQNQEALVFYANRWKYAYSN